MVYLHKDITLNEALSMAGLIGAHLRSDLRGNLVITTAARARYPTQEKTDHEPIHRPPDRLPAR